MNKIYQRGIALLSLLTIGLTSCNKTTEINLPKVVEHNSTSDKATITLSATDLRVKVGGEQSTLNITSGGGDYQVSVLNPSLAEAMVDGNTITLKALKTGKTELLISDKTGATALLPITAFTKEQITLSQSRVEITGRVGRRSTGQLLITDGNGGYQVSSNNDKVGVRITGKTQVSLTATIEKDSYTAIITITDEGDISQTFEVVVSPRGSTNSSSSSPSNPTPEPSPAPSPDPAPAPAPSPDPAPAPSSESNTRPYTQEEIDMLVLGNSEKQFFHDPTGQIAGSPIRNRTNGNIQMGREMQGGIDTKIQITYPGTDQSVGVKTGATIYFKNYGQVIANNLPIRLEILKNENGRVWGIFSWTNEQGRQEKGFFCDSLVP